MTQFITVPEPQSPWGDGLFPPLEPYPEESGLPWWPINSAQQAAGHCPAELLLYGGASGGGKSQFLVADAAQEWENPALRGLLLRKTRTGMNELKAIARQIYRPMGARWVAQENHWMFPAGGTVRLGYLRYDKDIDLYQGNPYTWLGVDESGQHPENRVRLMVAWLAAAEHTGLFARGRFTCNPGGEGYTWEMQVFLRYKCPVHYPADRLDRKPRETSVYPGRIYRGTTWTDGSPVWKTTTFIPAFLHENPTYYKAKIASLMSQTAAVRKQLIDGCWCNAEGIYFDFLQPGMVVPIQTVGEEWWWNHFISIDYGFGNSSAAAGMYAVSPMGRIFKTRERDEPKLDSVSFAKAICERGFEANDRAGRQAAWLTKLRDRDPERPRISFVVFDCANDSHHGSGKSNFELMAPIFRKHGIPCIKAGAEAKDSQASAMNLYNGLATGELVLTSAVPRTYKSLTSRVIDERRAIKKIHGDPLDDLLDETRYGYNTFIGPSAEPDRLGLERQLEEMRQRGVDENSIAHFKWRREEQIGQQEREKAKGIPLVGGGLAGLGYRR